MKKRKRPNISEESYWKSAADIMAAVVLIVMLVLMLLLLYLMQMKNNDNNHLGDHDYYFTFDDDDGVGNTVPTELYTQPYTVPYYNWDEGGGGGGGGGGDGADDPGTDEPHPDEGNDKTAVLVTVVDDETGNVIKKEGILFELYAQKHGKGGLQKLHTYYPVKTEYKQYETTKDGTFYLPEKITRGWYSFHNLKPPEGYGLADDFDFEITKSLDWPEPYRVEIPMSPSKNKIYVRNIDADSRVRVGGEVYEVYAAEDIVTLDGTLRCKQGQKVDEIKCDEHGDGASKKLFLGKYYLVQKTSPQYYARYLKHIDVTVKLTDTEKDAAVIECEKTSAVFTLTDEYSGKPIEGAVYTVTGRENVKTGENGKAVVTELEKETTYTVTLQSVPKPYRISSEPVKFTVDKDGLIGGAASHEEKQTAYMTRLSVDVKDIIFKNSVADTSYTLYAENGNVVEEWDANGEARLIEGLDPGVYHLELNGDSSSRIRVTVKDKAELQKSETFIWTMWDTILVVASAVIAGLLIFLAVRIIIKVRRKRKANE